MKRRLIAVALLLVVEALVASCSSDKSTGPTPVTPTTTTTTIPAVVPSLTGTVSAQGGARLSGALVFIADGANRGRETNTDGNGAYRFDSLISSSGNVFARATGYDETGSGVLLDGPKTLNFTLRTTSPWTVAGFGNTVFEMPTWVSRTRATGHFVDRGGNSNFIVSLNGRTLINEILRQTDYDGTHITTGGGTVAISSSSSIQWSFTEVR